ncbi:MAG: hypothetical protein NVSMB62_09310 [Acidobacteriaceae bacterium]
MEFTMRTGTLLRGSVHSAVMFSTLLVSSPAVSQSDAAPRRALPGEQQHAPANRIMLPGVPNFHEVTPRVYRGGQPSAEGLDSLAKFGIGIVVDGRKFHKKENERVTRLGMQYVSIPWHCPFPKDKVFAKFLAVIRANPKAKIFVHCRLGDDRVGMMIASYRMAEQGWTAEQAMDEMKRDGFTFSHHFICPGLARYEAQFPERYRTHAIFRSAE